MMTEQKAVQTVQTFPDIAPEEFTKSQKPPAGMGGAGQGEEWGERRTLAALRAEENELGAALSAACWTGLSYGGRAAWQWELRRAGVRGFWGVLRSIVGAKLATRGEVWAWLSAESKLFGSLSQFVGMAAAYKAAGKLRESDKGEASQASIDEAAGAVAAACVGVWQSWADGSALKDRWTKRNGAGWVVKGQTIGDKPGDKPAKPGGQSAWATGCAPLVPRSAVYRVAGRVAFNSLRSWSRVGMSGDTSKTINWRALTDDIQADGERDTMDMGEHSRAVRLGVCRWLHLVLVRGFMAQWPGVVMPADFIGPILPALPANVFALRRQAALRRWRVLASVVLGSDLPSACEVAGWSSATCWAQACQRAGVFESLRAERAGQGVADDCATAARRYGLEVGALVKQLRACGRAESLASDDIRARGARAVATKTRRAMRGVIPGGPMGEQSQRDFARGERGRSQFFRRSEGVSAPVEIFPVESSDHTQREQSANWRARRDFSALRAPVAGVRVVYSWSKQAGVALDIRTKRGPIWRKLQVAIERAKFWRKAGAARDKSNGVAFERVLAGCLAGAFGDLAALVIPKQDKPAKGKGKRAAKDQARRAVAVSAPVFHLPAVRPVSILVVR